MKTRFRHLTEKYKTVRLQPDVYYSSRLIQTLFNKFTKKGKKALARRKFKLGAEQTRRQYNGPALQHLLVRSLRNVRTQFLLLNVRKGGQIQQVPVPLRRNKRDAVSLQTLASARRNRKERTFPERVEQELTTVYYRKSQSATLKARNVLFAKIYEERVLIDER